MTICSNCNGTRVHYANNTDREADVGGKPCPACTATLSADQVFLLERFAGVRKLALSADILDVAALLSMGYLRTVTDKNGLPTFISTPEGDLRAEKAQRDRAAAIGPSVAG